MKKNLFLLFSLISLLPHLLLAQVQGNATRFQQEQERSLGNSYNKPMNSPSTSTYGNNSSTVPNNILPAATINNNRIVELNVRVLSNQKADRYVAIFNLTQIAETADKTNQLMKTRVDGFQGALQGIGIPKEQIYVDVVNFIPLYEYAPDKKIFSNTNNEVPKGYELQQNIHIAYTQADQLQKIMTTAAKYEIFDLITVEYQIDDHEQVYTTMREQAMANLSQQLKNYEEQLGLDFEAAERSLAESKRVAYPSSRYSSYQAFANVSIGDLNDRSKTKDMYKPTTYYYDQLRAENFDIVLEPQVLEPVVQFVYELRLRLVMKSPQQLERQYIWVTPNGQQIVVQPDSDK